MESTKKLHSLGLFFIDLGVLKWCNALSKTPFSNSKTNPKTLVEYLQMHFLNHPVCFYFLERIIDRQIDILFWVLRYPSQCIGLERLPKLPQNEICYRLHSKYTLFPCFPIICSSVIWKSLFLKNLSYLHQFWYPEGSWLNVSKLLATTSSTCRLFSCTFDESISIDVSKKSYVMSCNLRICSKNVPSSRGHYL